MMQYNMQYSLYNTTYMYIVYLRQWLFWWMSMS